MGHSKVRGGRTLTEPASLCSGCYCMVLPDFWPRMGAYMDPKGRCCTFDASAAGFGKGEAVMSFCLMGYMETVDGQHVVKEDFQDRAVISGYRCVTNGSSVGVPFHAPSSVAAQQCLTNAVRQAGIKMLDVDAVECHGMAGLLADAIEVSSVSKALRSGDGSTEEPLLLCAAKPNIGASAEACGIAASIKAIENQRYGVIAPCPHLRQLNPHMDVADSGVSIAAEAMSFRMRSSYNTVMCQGFNGMNISFIFWRSVDENRVPPPKPALDRQVFVYWPAGGGSLDLDQKPMLGYYIVGSWSSSAWERGILMDDAGEGTWTSTVTLGENGYERFQIWLDEDSERVLQPAVPLGQSGSAVHGPSDGSSGFKWIIDGRSVFVPVESGDPEGAIEDQASAGAVQSLQEISGRDKGKPGDRYLVTLSVKGKWRMVTWEKVYAVADPAESLAPELAGSYCVVLFTSGNEWTFHEMKKSTSRGRNSVTVGPFETSGTSEFQIIRNKDWDQTFYPTEAYEGGEPGAAAEGPEEWHSCYGLTWILEHNKGDAFKIDFQRVLEIESDLKRISWRKVEKEAKR